MENQVALDRVRTFINRCQIIATGNPDKLERLHPRVTVEAEYGDRVVEGSVLTLAHHGPRAAQPCPCVAKVDRGVANFMLDQAERVIGLSHVDLDTVGGVLRVAESLDDLSGWQLGPQSFWELAAYVDTHGPHRLSERRPTSDDTHMLWAWWAWSSNARLAVPRDGTIDAGVWFSEAVTVLGEIFGVFGDAKRTSRMNAGRDLHAREDDVNAGSFVELTSQGVCVRVSSQFVNHLYRTPDGQLARVVVAYNTRTGAITVSRESDDVPLNARVLVQSLWGDEAGGHDGIAGAPRGRRMTLNDLVQCCDQANSLLEVV